MSRYEVPEPIINSPFDELAKKLERPVHPPGRDVRCIVSVGMLTEGWDCNTVTNNTGGAQFQASACIYGIVR